MVSVTMADLQLLLGEDFVKVRPSIVKALDGDGNAAIMLSHFINWSCGKTASENNGWFFLTGSDIQEQIGLSRTTQNRIKKMLKDKKLLEEETRGFKNKTHYRVNLEAVWSLMRDASCKGSCKDGATTSCKDGLATHIVDTKVDNINNYSPSQTARASSLAPLDSHATDDDYFLAYLSPGTGTLEQFVTWVSRTYPRKPDGVGASEEQAKAFTVRLIKACKSGNETRIQKAKSEFDQFREGVKRLKKAVDTGKRDRAFIPSFANFAGLGIMYGKPPGYVEWANAEIPRESAPKSTPTRVIDGVPIKMAGGLI